MISKRSGTRFCLLVSLGILGLTLWLTAADTLPSTLSDREFWSLIERVSEPDGYFRSNSGSTDNLLSNENGLSTAATALSMRPKGSGVYLGVGPEQNFTYIAAMRSRIAFVADIRRGNMLLHLMYKALFETSANRADFVARLFNRKRPTGLTTRSTAEELMKAYLRSEPVDEGSFDTNVKSIIDHLTRTHSLRLSPDDLDGIRYVYGKFRQFGPAINYTSSINGRSGSASYASLMATTDGTGAERSYLASEDSFTFVKNMETRNLIVPIVGDFAGAKALRAVGAFLKDRGGPLPRSTCQTSRTISSVTACGPISALTLPHCLWIRTAFSSGSTAAGRACFLQWPSKLRAARRSSFTCPHDPGFRHLTYSPLSLVSGNCSIRRQRLVQFPGSRFTSKWSWVIRFRQRRTTEAETMGRIAVFLLPVMVATCVLLAQDPQSQVQYRIGQIKITGEKVFNETLIRAVLRLVSGGEFSESLLRNGFDDLKQLYGNRGYINFTPVPILDFDQQQKVVNLTINIDEDRQFIVNRINFIGNTTTRDEVIRRQILVKEGGVFNSSAWRISLLRLNQLRLFEEIKNEDASIKPSPYEPKVDIDLRVKEKKHK